MKAIRLDDGALSLRSDLSVPRREGEALVQVLCAGICSTDLEIVKGYAGFSGTLGHEFVGRVVESSGSIPIGSRVVGEINVGCNACPECLESDSRHCPERTVLGIKGRDGAFAEYLTLPGRNLVVIPDSLTDEEAVFVEPLAAACHVLEQVEAAAGSTVAVIGDGKLAQLIVRVLAHAGCATAMIGKHRQKLDLCKIAGVRTMLLESATGAGDLLAALGGEKLNIVVEASGSASGMQLALALIKPRGSIVLKSTYHGATRLDAWKIVVDEISIVGSRCGRFQPAIDLLASGAVDVRPLVTARFPLDNGIAAFRAAANPANLKVTLDIAMKGASS
ncbi:MAG TPA: alcohol dehydrogenase catalytic domain-containing protein [Blastocatellia bacterium]|nr:alcohol dehydrogenase catalytic domain-containing protein [Blastocatellia bacterium]